MGLVAYGFNLNQKNTQTIREMASVITDKPIDVIDLRSFDPTAPEDSVVFFYGESMQVKQAKDKEYKIKVEFPDVDLLDEDFGDIEERRLAYEKLLKIKEALATIDKVEDEVAESELGTQTEQSESITIHEEELPKLSSTEVLHQLVKAMQENGTKEWTGSTTGGHKVRLTVEPSHSDAEINMTFAELYFIRAAMETLQLKELKIVPRPNAYWKSSPWRDDPESHPTRTENN